MLARGGCVLLAATSALVLLGCPSHDDAKALPDADSDGACWSLAVPMHPTSGGRPKVLVFTKSLVEKHESVTYGVGAIRRLGVDKSNFDVDDSEDAGAFTDANLAQYAAVVFLSTTVENDVVTAGGGANPNAGRTIMDPLQKAAFERFIAAGGGYVGIHAASDGDYTWDWYAGLVGAMFKSHVVSAGDTLPTATVHLEDVLHPSSTGLPPTWMRSDEWYNFRTNPRASVHVLATVDETTYDAETGAPPQDHPITWCHEYKGGRAWYTGMGHAKEQYCDPLFLKHLVGGIEYAAKMKPGDCSPPPARDAGDEGG